MQVERIAECSEHSAILLTFMKLPFAIKAFVVSIFEWPLKTDFTVSLSTLIYSCFFFSFLYQINFSSWIKMLGIAAEISADLNLQEMHLNKILHILERKL